MAAQAARGHLALRRRARRAILRRVQRGAHGGRDGRQRHRGGDRGRADRPPHGDRRAGAQRPRRPGRAAGAATRVRARTGGARRPRSGRRRLCRRGGGAHAGAWLRRRHRSRRGTACDGQRARDRRPARSRRLRGHRRRLQRGGQARAHPVQGAADPGRHRFAGHLAEDHPLPGQRRRRPDPDRHVDVPARRRALRARRGTRHDIEHQGAHPGGRMNLGSDLGHLTYSTLVHPADTWEDTWASLTTYLPKVKQRVSPDAPFGVSLRLSARSAATLTGDGDERARLKAFLDENGLYVYTVNAFVYGEFKGTVVKEQVYEPDWRTEDRVRYTTDVADILAEIAPAWVDPSIQTPPLAFKGRVTSPELVDELARQVLRVGAHLVDLERRTGRTVTLAIEPEPHCLLETTDETIVFFRDRLYSGSGASAFAAAAGLPLSEAHAALRRHIGVVYDVCHQAVEYEEPRDALRDLLDAGIPVLKLQLAAALRVPVVTQADVDRLQRFADSIYLTQTVERRGGRITRYL